MSVLNREAVKSKTTPPANSYRQRTAALQANLAVELLDGLLISHHANRRYLSGYAASDIFPNETAGFLLVTARHCFMITNSLYADEAERETTPNGFELVQLKSGESFGKTVAELIKKLNLRRVGFETVALVYDFWEDLVQHLSAATQLIGTRNVVEGLRVIKDAEEIKLMRRAIAISDQAFNEASLLVKPGMTEKQLAWEIERRIRELGGEALAFDTIIAGGSNGATPHAVPGERPFEDSDPLIIDMGARYAGYNSDMTRTLCVGSVSEQFKQIYNIVLAAQEASTNTIKPGITGNEADKAARDVITEKGYGVKFTHSTGHGIGLAVHEPPSLRRNSANVLATNMIHSVEPGIYLPGWGGVRIEDLVLVTSTGHETLTKANKHGEYPL